MSTLGPISPFGAHPRQNKKTKKTKGQKENIILKKKTFF
jgi:hypothetical protein